MGPSVTAAFDVFDVHLHARPPEAFLGVAQARFGRHAQTAGTNVTDAAVLLEQTLAQMDRNGVRRGLVSGRHDLVRAWCVAAPGRFLASFDPTRLAGDPQQGAEAFDGEAEQGRWQALGELGLPYTGRPLNDPGLFPYYAVCERRGLPVLFHTGLDGPDPQRLLAPSFRVELGDPLLLQDVVVRFPELKVVIMHMGWPFFDHALYMLYAYPNVYLDTAVVNWIVGPSLFARMLRETVETASSDRVLFGSDQMVWPQMIAPAVEAVAGAEYLSEADKRAILWNNAARLLAIT